MNLGVCVKVVLVPDEVLLVLLHLLGGEDGEAGHLPQAARPHVPAQPGSVAHIINKIFLKTGPGFLSAPGEKMRRLFRTIFSQMHSQNSSLLEH